MADLAALRDEFVAAFAAGESPSLRAWLDRVDESERQELESLIDQYLMTAPRRAWDPEAFESSLAKVAVDRVFESREGVSGNWPQLLPQLRNRARMRRSDLVARLTEALGVGTDQAQVDKVGVYYNEMEHGLLPAEGVSDTVLSALAGLVDSTLQALRDAGAGRLDPPPGSAPAFARVAQPDVDYEVRSMAFDRAEGPAGGQASPGERDRIDELFTGG